MWTLTPTESAKVDPGVGVTAGGTGYVGAAVVVVVAGAVVVVDVVVVVGVGDEVGVVTLVGETVVVVVVVVVVLRAFATTARRVARMLRWRVVHVTTGRLAALMRPSRRLSVTLAPWRATREPFWPATRHVAQRRRARGTSVMATRST